MKFSEIMPFQHIPHAADFLSKDIGAAPKIARVISRFKYIRNGIHINQYNLAFYREKMSSNNASLNVDSVEDSSVHIGGMPDTYFGYNALLMRQIKLIKR